MHVDASVFELLVCVDHRIRLSDVRHGFSEDKEACGSFPFRDVLDRSFQNSFQKPRTEPKDFSASGCLN